jgi:Protein of unknown function (DUF2630)
MDDAAIVRQINELTEEEHRLELSKSGRGLSDEEHDRVRSIEIALDQCWDLLRRRRARREVGQDPDDVSLRSAEVVEGYQQ